MTLDLDTERVRIDVVGTDLDQGTLSAIFREQDQLQAQFDAVIGSFDSDR